AESARRLAASCSAPAIGGGSSRPPGSQCCTMKSSSACGGCASWLAGLGSACSSAACLAPLFASKVWLMPTTICRVHRSAQARPRAPALDASREGLASVHGEHLARDEVVLREEDNRPRHILRGAEPPERDLCDHPGAGGLVVRL